MNTPIRCDCCGLMVRLTSEDDCPRCGYPVTLEKEAQFLADNIQNLQRVVTYGGASLPVASLVARYEQRRNYLLWLRAQQTTPSVAPSMPVQQQGSTTNSFPVPQSSGNDDAKPVSSVENPTTPFPVVAENLPEKLPVSQEPAQPSLQVPSAEITPPVVPHKTAQPFSLKAFFADQTINIVSSLGAFLILIGSLSFVVTTPNLGLSFFTLLVVHALFGVLGAITYRFKSFRIVSVIYTAIFALQVPLVGLAGYRLVSGNLLQFPASGLVAIAAGYAAVVYGALAIYQRFQPFAYLAAVSVVVVDLALALTLHLDFWWWPSTLLVLALASLVCVAPATGNAPGVQQPWNILFQPVRVLMKGYVYTSYVYVCLSWLLLLMVGSVSLWSTEIRYSIACTLLLLFCWTCLFVWRSRSGVWLLQLPYLFLACILAFAYAFSFSSSGYVIVLTGMALFYHGIERFAYRSLQSVQILRGHIAFLVLASVSVVPLIADADLPFRVFAKAYGFNSFIIISTSEVLISIVALVCCIALTGSIIISHTGWPKSPSQTATQWCWLLLLSGVLFYWVYNLVGLMLPVVPVWSALVLTGILLLVTIATRRLTSAAWADPLDILTLVSAAQTLLLAMPQGHMVLLSLLLAFTGITYAVALYQRRVSMLVLTLIFALLACFPLSDSGQAQGTAPTVLLAQGTAPTVLLAQSAIPTVLLTLCILLPLVWASLARFLPLYQRFAGNSHVLLGSFWALPVLLISLLYTLEFLSAEVYRAVSTLGLWLQIPFPLGLELALLACIWYSTAIVVRVKVGLVVAAGLACWALFFLLGNSQALAAVAFGSVLLAVALSRFVGRDWGIPLYIVGLLAAFVLGGSGQLQHALVLLLLSFGVLIYLLSLVERESWLAAGLRWLAVVFVIWSLYDAGLLSEYAWVPVLALLGAGIGLGIRMIPPLVSPTFADRNKLWSYAGPCYTISLVSAILMGLDGLLLGIGRPFYGAIPYALLAYAVVVYGVLLLEKYSRGLFLTAGFAIWGLVLMVQMPVIYGMAVGLALGLVGLGCGRILKLNSTQRVAYGSMVNIQWNWPWYLAFLVAALLTGGWNFLVMNKADAAFLANGLLAFAALAYVIVLVEEMPLWLGWVSAGLAIWSLFMAAFYADQVRLFSMALFCAVAGVLTRLIERFLPSSYQQWWQVRRFESARLLYSVALVAAVLSGFLRTNIPFYAAVPGILMLYGLIAYGVALWERRLSWFRLCVGFMIWGVCLLPPSANCQLQSVQVIPTCYEQRWTVPLTAALLAGVTLVSALLGLCIGRLSGSPRASIPGLAPMNILRTRFRWNWPWYLVAFVALMVTLAWCAVMSSALPLHTLAVVLALFLGLMFALMIAERLPDLALLVIGLAIWLIAQTGWATWQMAGAYSLLCLCVFAGQWLWLRIPPVLELVSSAWLARVVSLSGLGLVIIFVCVQGGLAPHAGPLAQSGVFALCIGAVLLWVTPKVTPLSSPASGLSRYACYYGAGLLLSLTIPWELLAFGQTDVAWLTLVPASYMIVTSPFLLRDKQRSDLRRVGHGLALCGAMLLLLPTLWSSFGHEEVVPTLLLAIESLLLFLLGAGMRIRFFVLSGAALVIVSAIHLLFLPALGIPTFLALTLSGVLLLALATALLVIRTRLAEVWSELN